MRTQTAVFLLSATAALAGPAAAQSASGEECHAARQAYHEAAEQLAQQIVSERANAHVAMVFSPTHEQLARDKMERNLKIYTDCVVAERLRSDK